MMASVVDIDHRLLERHTHGIIDRALLDEDPVDLPFLPMAPAFMKDDIGRCPGLVAIHELTPERRVTLLGDIQKQCEAGERPLFCGLLESKAGTQTLHKHLISRLVVKRPPDREPAQFRFYDPRVFVQLREMLDDDTLAALLGPIDRWTYFLPDSGWFTEEKPRVTTPHAIFRLPSPIQARLARLGAVNRVLAHLPAPADPAAWRTAARDIDTLVERAHSQHGIIDTEDKVQFALHGVHIHPRFDSHPKVTEIIAGLKAQDTNYSDATALLSDHDWQHIRNELNAPRETTS